MTWQQCHIIVVIIVGVGSGWCHVVIIGVGVAACHTSIVVPLGQHPHEQWLAGWMVDSGAGNIIETPPSHVWSEGGGVLP